MKVKNKETLNCVRHPERKAHTWAGFVVKKNTKDKILAGWCSVQCSVRGYAFHGWIE